MGNTGVFRIKFGILTLILLSLFGSYESWLLIWVFLVEFKGAKNPGVLPDLYFIKFFGVLGFFVTNLGFLC